MTLMTVLIIAALAGVLASLGLGIAAMASHGEIAHRSSAQWMTIRVALQAVVVGLLLVAAFLA